MIWSEGNNNEQGHEHNSWHNSWLHVLRCLEAAQVAITSRECIEHRHTCFTHLWFKKLMSTISQKMHWDMVRSRNWLKQKFQSIAKLRKETKETHEGDALSHIAPQVEMRMTLFKCERVCEILHVGHGSYSTAWSSSATCQVFPSSVMDVGIWDRAN